MIQITEHQLQNPDGSTFSLTGITQESNAGAIIVPCIYLRGLTYVGLVTQWRELIQQETVEFPRGSTLDHSEAEAEREFTEETGLHPLSIRHIGDIFPDTGLITNKVGVFVAIVDGQFLRYTYSNDFENQLRFAFYTVSEAQVKLVRSGCSMSLAAYTLANDEQSLFAKN